MIHITVDMTLATADEIECFYSLPGIGRALDTLVLSDSRGFHLQLLQPARLNGPLQPDSDSGNLEPAPH